MKHIGVIDFLRGYSIFTIVLMHLLLGNVTGVFTKAILFGGAGVHVFVLCSGFGLYLSYLRKPTNYLVFLKRRFGKVWIPYALVVLLWGIWFKSTSGDFPVREVTSHLLLYKMFSTELDVSLCNPYWFISTIIQFYIAWPLIVRVFRLAKGYLLVISLLWSTTVGLLGLEAERPWGSFFLQYLWEFGLGMWIAERYMIDEERGKKLMDIRSYRLWWLLVGAVGGMGLSAYMAWNGGLLKLYNDIPSLFGYLSVALIIYKVKVWFVNHFFEWASDFSYELYLMHMLVYAVSAYMMALYVPIAIRLTISFLFAYFVSWVYKKIINELIIKIRI